MTNSETSPLLALRHTQDQLADLAAGLDPAGMRAPSYDSEWTIAQVFSHLGSGAEVFSLFLDAGTGQAAQSPTREAFPPIWDRWNAKSAEAQVTDSVAANEALVGRLEGLSPEETAAIRVDFFGNEFDAEGFIVTRLGEHAVHVWDIAVVGHPDAPMAPDSVELLVDRLPALAARSGSADAGPFAVRISTTGPERTFDLVVGDTVELRADPSADDAVDGRVAMSAEALVRLVYGRLDAEHTPSGVTVEGPVDLDRLRRTFPGF